MQKRIEKGSEEWQLVQDYYRFRQDYYIPENSDSWFKLLVSEGEKLISKYANTEFCDYAKDLIMAHLADCDRRWRNGTKQKDMSNMQ